MVNAKKVFLIFILIGLIAVLLWTSIFFIVPVIFNLEINGYCGDGTYNGRCSDIKPFFCINETLVENSSYCGCQENFSVSEEKCISSFQTGERKITLEYILNGEKKSFQYIVYAGVVDYLFKMDKFITYTSTQENSRADFEIKAINESIQKQFLFPLVVDIYNLGNNLDERTEIAISMIQLFEYKSSNKTIDFYGTALEYSRYPYEVIYEKKGICGEKSQLLAFILRELGYEVVLFYFPTENHEAVGVKCSYGDFRETGYCYIETTSVFEIGIDPKNVIGTGDFNNFQIIKISKGKAYR